MHHPRSRRVPDHGGNLIPRVLPFLLLGAAGGGAQAASVYHIGNSLVIENDQERVIKALALQAGHTHAYSMSVILGAPLAYIWDHADSSGGFEGQTYPQGLAAKNAWDALVLEPYDRGFQYYPYDVPSADGYSENDVLNSDNFYRLALAGNAHNQLFIYEVFPLRDTFANPTEERTLGHAETVATQVGALHPTSPTPLIIPVGEIVSALGALADQGKLPHIADHEALYADNAHMNEVGTYAVALAHLACLYREDPHRYSNQPVFPPGEDWTAGDPIWKDPAAYPLLGPNGGEVWSDTATVIKNTVWDVISNYQASGVAQGLTIETSSLPGGFMGQSYSAKLMAQHGTPPYRWSLGDSRLPEGLALIGDTVAGTPAEAGSAAFTILVADSATPPHTAQRGLSLTVTSLAIPLAVTIASLPSAERGARYEQTLAASGGVAPCHWSLVSGDLPVGLTLSDSGDLSGSPGQEGSFPLSIAVADSTPGAHQTARATLGLTVAALGPSTTLANHTVDPVTVDGRLDEGAWHLIGSADRVSQGSAANRVTFGTLWNEDFLYVGANVIDSHVLASSSGPKNPGDAIEVFLDGDNSKEAIAGEHDRRIVIDPDGKLWVPDGRTTGIQGAAARNGTGYSVELAIPWSNLGATSYDNMTVGFDIANDNHEDNNSITQRQFWFGDDTDLSSPRRWGNLLLAPENSRTLVTVSAVSSPIRANDGCGVGRPSRSNYEIYGAVALLALWVWRRVEV